MHPGDRVVIDQGGRALAGQIGLDKGEQQDHRDQNEKPHRHLVAAEHREGAFPIGIVGITGLLGAVGVVVGKLEQLGVHGLLQRLLCRLCQLFFFLDSIGHCLPCPLFFCKADARVHQSHQQITGQKPQNAQHRKHQHQRLHHCVVLPLDDVHQQPAHAGN